MKKLKVPSLVTILILTVITIVFWIVFGVVRIFQTKPAPSVPPEILDPLNPNYDKTTVDKIQERIYFDNEQTFEAAQPNPSPTAAPTPSPTQLP